MATTWIWKYRIIQTFKDLKNDDLIVYCDADSCLNYKAKKRFDEYIEIINDSAYVNFRMECEPSKEFQYTTKELFNYFNISMIQN